MQNLKSLKVQKTYPLVASEGKKTNLLATEGSAFVLGLPNVLLVGWLP